MIFPTHALAQLPTPIAGSTQTEVSFDVNAQHIITYISPLIYGANTGYGSVDGDITDGRHKYLSFQRASGNRISAYNWENNASNAGADYHNQNDNFLAISDKPGAAFIPAIAKTLNNGGYFLLGIPMTGYVAADKGGDGDVNARSDFLTTRFNQSLPKKPSPFSLTPDLTDGKVFEDEFVNFLKIKMPKAFDSTPSLIFFELDNEPDLWATTHPRIRGGAKDNGKKLTYSELFERSEAYASAIKDVAPTTLIFGPANFGWSGYVDLSGAPDANGRDFLDSYLDYMKSAESRTGQRLLDVLDVHWYPEARSATNVRITEPDTTPEVVAARLQAPRSLYDPSYLENSWIPALLPGGPGPIQLIPRLRNKIAQHYPGTELAITEYNFGAGNHISGGIAEADALGIFGREGLFAANLWPYYDGEDFALGGMEMYVNYDGQGGHFGDTAIAASTSDIAKTSIYASTYETDRTRMVVVLLNKSTHVISTLTRISSLEHFTTGHLWRLAGEDSTPEDADLVSLSNNEISLILPPLSVTTIDLRCELPSK